MKLDRIKTTNTQMPHPHERERLHFHILQWYSNIKTGYDREGLQ